MSDYLMREFRAQLTISMDSVLKRAVFEIMMIFENSLHHHQMELRQKGEEIAQLIIELQKAEIKLKEIEFGVNRGVEMNKTQLTETQREPVDAPQQTSDVPEIDFEVPDDWCAPLGCETVSKQDYTMCPSVQLRKLSIPLCPIPAIKEEVVSHDIDSHRQEKVLRRSKRGSTLNKSQKQTQGTNLQKGDKITRRTPLRNNVKLLRDIKQKYTDLAGGTARQKRMRKRKEESEIAPTESKEMESVTDDSEKRYTCRFCKKVFDTEFGRSVHARSHKRCRGCKKVFPFPSALGYHSTYCKKLLAKEARFSKLSKPESCEEEMLPPPSLKHVSVNRDTTQSFSNHNESSRRKDGPIRKYACEQCNKVFHKRCKLNEHFRVHTGERPYPCSMCPKKFRLNQSRKKHVLRIHNKVKHSSEINGHRAWAKPLEETKNDQDKSQAIRHKNVPRDTSPSTRPSSRWRSMGTRCSGGYACLLCQKVSKDIYLLIEHFRIHTGERPLQCQGCHAGFRSRGQLSMHKKRCRNPKTVTECAKCEKKFSAQEKYNRHMSKCHKEWPIHCKVCGRGFFLKWRLSDHMKRLHK